MPVQNIVARRGRGIDRMRGTTLIELVVVLAIAWVIAAIGVPSFLEWRQGLACRETAQGILRVFRETRSLTLATNREHRVEFDIMNQRYGVRKGNRAQDTAWNTVPPVRSWIRCTHSVLIRSNVQSIQFNPNGTANGGTITVKDSLGDRTYHIIVARTGRIRVK